MGIIKGQIGIIHGYAGVCGNNGESNSEEHGNWGYIGREFYGDI